jgi:tRNA A37 threonylcarbamoyladenosine modification protein TsaB
VFCAQYSPDAKRQGNYLNIHPEFLSDLIKEETLFVGDGLDIYEEKLKSILESNFHPGPKDLWYPRAGTMGIMALDRDTQDIDIQPIYVRPSDADLTLKKQKG